MAVQGVGEILFDDQGSAGGIDQEGGGFHPGEAFGVDQALGFRREGAVQADGIALGKQLVEGGVFDSLGRGGGHVAAVGEEAHAEGLADAGDGPADLAQADQPQGSSGQFHLRGKPVAVVGAAAPAAVADIGGVEARLVGQFQQKGEGVLGDGRGAVAGHVGNDQSPLPGGGQIDGIATGGKDADISQPGGGGDGAGIQNGLVQQDGVGLADAFRDFRGRRAVMDHAVGEGFQGGPGEVAGVGGMGIQNHEFRAFHAGEYRQAGRSIQGRRTSAGRSQGGGRIRFDRLDLRFFKTCSILLS